MHASDDAEAVRVATRLGWYVAEVWGRNKPGAPAEQGPELGNPAGYALPIQMRVSAVKSRTQAQQVLQAMAEKLDVDTRAEGIPSYSNEVNDQAAKLWRLRMDGKPADAEWNCL